MAHSSPDERNRGQSHARKERGHCKGKMVTLYVFTGQIRTCTDIHNHLERKKSCGEGQIIGASIYSARTDVEGHGFSTDEENPGLVAQVGDLGGQPCAQIFFRRVESSPEPNTALNSIRKARIAKNAARDDDLTQSRTGLVPLSRSRCRCDGHPVFVKGYSFILPEQLHTRIVVTCANEHAVGDISLVESKRQPCPRVRSYQFDDRLRAIRVLQVNDYLISAAETHLDSAVSCSIYKVELFDCEFVERAISHVAPPPRDYYLPDWLFLTTWVILPRCPAPVKPSLYQFVKSTYFYDIICKMIPSAKRGCISKGTS